MKNKIDYTSFIRDIQDYPKEGIVFKDITNLWKDPEALKTSAREISEKFKTSGIKKVIGAEARGFITGALVAAELNAGFVPVRKPGKLPWDSISESYELEYGKDFLEMHKDAIDTGENVLIIDDLVATGGTISAVIKLCERLGANVVAAACIVELAFLNPREKISVPVHSLIKY